MIAPISVFFLLPLIMYGLYRRFYYTHLQTQMYTLITAIVFDHFTVDIRDNPLLSISCVT